MLSGSIGGGGGGGGGGAGGAGVDAGGGVGAVPGTGMFGVIGVPVSSCTHEDRSKNMNSSVFSWAVSAGIGETQPFGAEFTFNISDLLVRTREQSVEQPKLVHHLER